MSPLQQRPLASSTAVCPSRRAGQAVLAHRGHRPQAARKPPFRVLSCALLPVPRTLGYAAP